MVHGDEFRDLQAAEKGRIGSKSRSLSGLKPDRFAITYDLKAVPFKEFGFFRSLFRRVRLLPWLPEMIRLTISSALRWHPVRR